MRPGQHRTSNDLASDQVWLAIGRTLASDRLLQRNGYHLEHNLWILDYDPAQEPRAQALVAWLQAEKLPELGARPAVVDLYDIVLACLDEQGLWEPLADAEQDPDVGRGDLVSMLADTVSVEGVLVPAIQEQVARAREEGPVDLVLITGTGPCWPYVRTHELLARLEGDTPVVLLFPGSYEPGPGGRATLDALNVPPEPYGGYYRAASIFDI